MSPKALQRYLYASVSTCWPLATPAVQVHCAVAVHLLLLFSAAATSAFTPFSLGAFSSSVRVLARIVAMVAVLKGCWELEC